MTKQKNRPAAGTLAFLILLLPAAVHVCAAETAPAAADWPQWRGPTRDGIAPPGPKLLDTWPKEGPPLVWKSDPIRGFHVDGGMGSVVVAEGKVIIYAHSRIADKPVKLITAELLKNWGWVEDMPEDLATKIEKARNASFRNLRSEFRIKAGIDTFLASIDPAQAAKYDEAIRNRLSMRCGYLFPSNDRNPARPVFPPGKTRRLDFPRC